MPQESLPELLRRLRATRGWSQLDLSREAGLGAGTLAMIEAGQRNNPSVDTLGRLADALGADVGDLARAARKKS